MTTGEVGRGLGDGGSEVARGPDQSSLSVDEVVALVDRILAERGRRNHLFGWLKAPGGGPEDWLPVDAYYPANRLVMVCQDLSTEEERLLAELVPAHGLRLLAVRGTELDAAPDSARAELERRLAELGPSPRHLPVPASPGVARSAPAKPAVTGESEAAGVLVGLVLAAALVIEVYFGVARLGFGSGNLLLAFGLALDACSRTLGTVAALRTGETEWAWWCALGGSPLTAGFALMQSTGPVKTEPAPLAGLIGVAAIVLLALSAVVGALGG